MEPPDLNKAVEIYKMEIWRLCSKCLHSINIICYTQDYLIENIQRFKISSGSLQVHRTDISLSIKWKFKAEKSAFLMTLFQA